MFDPHALLLFVVAGLALNFTPGPDLLYITARSLGQGWRAGAASAFGIAAGCGVHTAGSACRPCAGVSCRPMSARCHRADPARGAFALQVLVLGLIFIFNGLWVCLLVARSAAAMADWARRRASAMNWIERGSGALLVGLGLHLALARK